jgi:alpha-tubulin suppressor-like RCC1 family protein
MNFKTLFSLFRRKLPLLILLLLSLGIHASAQNLGTTKTITFFDAEPGCIADYYDVKLLAADGSFTLMVRDNGIVYAVGANYYGQLGNGTTSGVPVKTLIKVKNGDGFVNNGLGGNKVTAVATGYNHSLIVTENGIVYAFGANTNGQLGNGTSNNSNKPIKVSDGGGFVNNGQGGNKVIAVSGSLYHSLILTKSGIVYAFGGNSSGQLGNKNIPRSSIPIKVSNGEGFVNDGSSGNKVTAIAAGHKHSLVLTESGKVYAFGENTYGQLGNGTNTDSRIPTKVSNSDDGRFVNNGQGGNKVTAIATLHNHSLISTESGKVYAFGHNAYGKLGNGSTNSNKPIKVSDGGGFVNDGSSGNRVTAIVAGREHSLISTESGKAYAFGQNTYGQLGNGGDTDSSIPTKVSNSDDGRFINNGQGGNKVTAMVAGHAHSLILTDSRVVYAFGNNQYGHLGSGSTTSSSVPTQGAGELFSLSGRAVKHSQAETTRYFDNVKINNVAAGATVQVKKDGGNYQNISLNSSGEYTIGNATPFVVKDGEMADFIIKVVGKNVEEYSFRIDKTKHFITKWAPGGGSITIPTTGTGYNYDIYITQLDKTPIEYGYGVGGNYTSGLLKQEVLVHITGKFPRIYFNNDGKGIEGSNLDHIGNADKLISIEQWGDYIQWANMESAFAGCEKLQITAKDKPNVSQVTDFKRIFWDCKTMNAPLTAWDVGKGTTFEYAFFNATSFNQDLSSWNIGSKATVLRGMFSRATAFANGSVPLKGWITDNVTDMGFMFHKCAFNQPLGAFKTDKVSTMEGMFADNTVFNQDLSNWITNSLTNTRWMFYGAIAFNQNIGNWNVSKCTDMGMMFENAKAFNNGDTENNGAKPLNWTMVNGTDKASGNFEKMFKGAVAFNQSLNSWDVSKGTNFYRMFSGATAFNNGDTGNNLTKPLSWTMVDGTDKANGSFYGMFSEAKFFNQALPADKWDTSQADNMQLMFQGANRFNQDISHFKINALVTAHEMLNDCGMSSANYDKLLLSWATQAADSGKNNVKFGARGVVYSCGGIDARRALIDRGWGDGTRQEKENYSSTDGTGIIDGGENCSRDYGDAPDSYGTTNSNKGALHVLTTDNNNNTTGAAGADGKPDLLLGAQIDDEDDGQAVSKGADNNGTNGDGADEDGVMILDSGVKTSSTYSCSVKLYNVTGKKAYVSAWLDINRNGMFESGERITQSTGNSGLLELMWTGINFSTVGHNYLRIRTSTDSLAISTPTGLAPDGEVEDYRIEVVEREPIDIRCKTNLYFEDFGHFGDAMRVDGIGCQGFIPHGGCPDNDFTRLPSPAYTDYRFRSFSYHFHFPYSLRIQNGEYCVVTGLLAHHTDHYYWSEGSDHTYGDSGNGRFLIVNTGAGKHTLYQVDVIKIQPNTVYEFGAWFANMVINHSLTHSHVAPDAKFEILSKSGVVLHTLTTGDLPKSSKSQINWQHHSLVFNSGNHTEVSLRLVNNKSATNGNDLALDDIYFTAYCDGGDLPDSDAPNSAVSSTGEGNYNTVYPHGVAHYTPADNANVYMGLVPPDLGDGQGRPSADAGLRGVDGDDFADNFQNIDDEDALTKGWYVTDQKTLILPGISVTNNTAKKAYLYGWVDFNNNGELEIKERAMVEILANHIAGNEVSLLFSNNNEGIIPDSLFVRLRIGTTRYEVETPVGLAKDGEIEDHLIDVVAYDYGDAPDTYKTTLSEDGVRHIVPHLSANVFIGTNAPDYDKDGKPGNNADGDDKDELDDENGLGLNYETNGSDITLSNISVVNNTSKTGFLYGWIDINHDGTFDNGERASASIAAGESKTLALSFTDFNGSIKPGNYIVRLRVGTVDAEVNQPTGLASNGEVEDHMICVYPDRIRVADAKALACTGSSVKLDGMIQYAPHFGKTIVWTLPDGTEIEAPGNYTTPKTVGDVIVLHYTVSENYCGIDVDGKGKLYLELHKDIDLDSVDKTVEICVDEAQNINLNTILGVAVTGEWKPTDEAYKKYLLGHRFNGTAAYGNSTGPKEYIFTITPAKGACATGTATVTVKIISVF